MTKVLVVEHEPELAKKLSDWLHSDHYIVEVQSDAKAALQRLSGYPYDLIVVDWDLPGVSGPEFCHTFRDSGGQAPVLMISHRSDVDDKETGLDAGADDYLVKPFQLKEISARLRALRRRCSFSFQGVLRAGDLVLDPDARTVTKLGTPIHLEPREFNLLEFLMRNQNKTFSAETLIRRVWESESSTTTDTLRAYIRSIRRKIDTPEVESIISTVHGVGYKIHLVPSEPEAAIDTNGNGNSISAKAVSAV